MTDGKEENMINRINENYPRMSKGQKKLTQFFMENYDRAAFLTAAGVGKEVGVSESTVVRYATFLGYSGYPGLQKDLEEMVQRRIHEAPQIDLENQNISRQEMLEQVLKKDMYNIRHTLEEIDRTAFDAAMDLMLHARRLYIVGFRNSAPLAQYLGFYLNLLLDEVEVVTADNATDMFEQLLRMNEEDCLIGISFPRYSMRTLKAMEFANSRNVAVISLTDNIHSPMNLYSSCNLVAKSDMSSVMDSLSAPMSVLNAIISYLMAKRKKILVNRLEMLEDISREYEVLGNDELNMVSNADVAEETEWQE